MLSRPSEYSHGSDTTVRSSDGRRRRFHIGVYCAHCKQPSKRSLRLEYSLVLVATALFASCIKAFS